MRRYGQVLKVKKEKIERYKELHSAVWPGVLNTIKKCNIRNYSIFLRDGFLFAYFEYIGDSFEADMKKMAACEITQKWWDECIPCQESIESATKEEWWVNMEEVFHMD